MTRDELPVKNVVADLLRKRDFQRLLDFCFADRRYWQEVRYRLYDLDEGLRWAAIEAVAKFMKKWWDSGKEENVRIYIRTLFWSLNDESGGIGWSSAQTIAEIIAQNPVLIDPYGSMMIAHCIDEPVLLGGCLWGIGRLGDLINESVQVFRAEILKAFGGDDPTILGLAAWAAGETGFAPAEPFLERLVARSEPATIYIEGNFVTMPVGKWADEALGKIRNIG